jgi:hypothetical protein
LASFFKTFLLAAAYLLIFCLLGLAIQVAAAVFISGPTPRLFGLPIAEFVITAALGFAIFASAAVYVWTHLKFDFAVPGYGYLDSIRTIHLTELWSAFYDARLDERVGYARHAISIDENRKDFRRVGWGERGISKPPDEEGNLWFEQVWFPGNHADIGGGYPENESRLSDIALNWIFESAASVPNGIKLDTRVLAPWPHPEGMQHDEVKVGYGPLPSLLGIGWTKKERSVGVPDATMHRSVYRRFDQPSVKLYDRMGAYRPETLRTHVDFARFYDEGAPFPATSESSATCMAREPGVRQKNDQA